MLYLSKEFDAQISKNKQTVIQKCDEGNSIVIVDRDDYMENIENFLSDQSKFQTIAVKDDNFLYFITNQEKRIDKIYKKLVDSNSMSEETRRHLKAVGTRPGIMYGSCEVHKKCVDGCPPFRPNLFALQTSTYKLAKYLVPILEPSPTNKYTVKDLFTLATKTVEQDSSNFMGNLDIDSLFTNVPLEETIKICTNNLFKNNNIVHGLKKSEFKDLLFLATKELYSIFNNILYQQIDEVAMVSPLGPSVANAFLAHHEQNWLDSCPLKHRPLYCQWYVDDIFALFKSSDHLKQF